MNAVLLAVILMLVLAVCSLKGGVGKTSVTLGLASGAHARGLRTLVVDLDHAASDPSRRTMTPAKRPVRPSRR